MSIQPCSSGDTVVPPGGAEQDLVPWAVRNGDGRNGTSCALQFPGKSEEEGFGDLAEDVAEKNNPKQDQDSPDFVPGDFK